MYVLSKSLFITKFIHIIEKINIANIVNLFTSASLFFEKNNIIPAIPIVAIVLTSCIVKNSFFVSAIGSLNETLYANRYTPNASTKNSSISTIYQMKNPLS